MQIRRSGVMLYPMPEDVPNEWQRRYDESLVREHESRDEEASGAAAVVEAGGCSGLVFPWVGAAVAIGAGLVAVILHRKRT